MAIKVNVKTQKQLMSIRGSGVGQMQTETGWAAGVKQKNSRFCRYPLQLAT